MPLWRIILGLGITQIIGWGTVYYAIGVLSQDMATETGWSKTLIFGAFSASLLLSGTISRMAGRAIDRHGARKIMTTGSAIAGLGCACLGLATSPVVYFAAWLIIGVAMRLCLYDAAFAALAQLAGGRARRAITYLSLYAGFSSTIFWPLSHALSQHVGWHGTYLVYAALHVLVCLPIHWLLLGAPAKPSDEDEETFAQEEPLRGRDRTTAMALLAAAMALNGIVFASISAHIAPLFEGLGFSASTAVTFGALIGPAQVASRLADLMLGRRLKSVELGLLAFGLLPLSLLIFAAGGFGSAAAIAFAIVYGASNGLITIAKGAVTLKLFGRDGYGLVLGTLATPNLILNAMAPTVFAVVLDRMGAVTGLYLALAVGLLSASSMAVLARRYPR